MDEKTLVVVARGRPECTYAFETLSRLVRHLQNVEVVQELDERVFEMLRGGDYAHLLVFGYVPGRPARRLRRVGIDPRRYGLRAFFSVDTGLIQSLLGEVGCVEEAERPKDMEEL